MRVGFWRAVGDDDRWAKRPSLAGLCLEAHAHDKLGLDVEFEFYATSDELLESGADVVAISAVTDVWAVATEVARRCRRQGQYVVLGGPHVSVAPESAAGVADAVVIGEGEEQFGSALVQLRFGAREAGEPVVIPRRRCVLDLEQATWLPLAAPQGGGYLAASVTRGCRYNCTFCSARRMWQGSARRFSPAYIGEWFGKRRGTFDSVGFYDLTFLADLDWARATVEALRAAGAGRDFEVTMVSARTDLLTDEACELVASIGVPAIGVGMESCSQRILSKLKPGVTVKDHERAVRLCYKHGLVLQGSFIFGTPGETEDDLRATYEFLERWLGKHFQTAGLYALTPYPGTHWWKWALQRGIIEEPVDWSRWHLEARTLEDWGACVYLNEDTLPRERTQRWRQRVSRLAHRRDPDRIPGGAL